MAQRTGAERLLAPSAKPAGARAILALAAAALALAGCGGGSEDPAQEDSSTATSAAASADASAAAATERSSPAAGAEAKPGQAAKATSSPAASDAAAAPQQQQGTGKHGPRIAVPKGPAEQAPTPEVIADATVADISLRGPGLIQSAEGPLRIPATYTCEGKDSWPELRWSGVPTDTAELILYAMSVQPVDEQLFVDWAVAGLDPALEGIEAGRLPRGAVVGTNGYGKRDYEICPAGAEIYMFALYALPRALSPQPGFDARELRARILDVSGNVGLLAALYARG